MDDLCGGCGKTGALTKRCSRCKQAYYCSTECQKASWPYHKRECEELAAMATPAPAPRPPPPPAAAAASGPAPTDVGAGVNINDLFTKMKLDVDAALGKGEKAAAPSLDDFFRSDMPEALPPFEGSIYEKVDDGRDPNLSYFDQYCRDTMGQSSWEMDRRQKEAKKAKEEEEAEKPRRKAPEPPGCPPPPEPALFEGLEAVEDEGPAGPLPPDEDPAEASRNAAQGAALSAMMARDCAPLRRQFDAMTARSFERRMRELRETHADALADRKMRSLADSERVNHREFITICREGLLKGDDFLDLVRFVETHPRLTKDAAAGCLGASFGRSAGFVCRFSGPTLKDASAKLRLREETAGLSIFFDAVAIEGCEAFVLNVLVCAGTPRKKRDPVPPRRKGDFAVHWHRDATVGLKTTPPEKIPLAHRVAVLYLGVPGDFDGGALLLRKPKRPPWRACWRMRDADPPPDDYIDVDERLLPAPNRLVEFRGGAEHAVEAFSYDEDEAQFHTFKGDRVSLVLEQYVVPDGLKADLVDFEVVDAQRYVPAEGGGDAPERKLDYGGVL